MVFIFLFHANTHMGCRFGILTTFVSQGAVFMVPFFMVSGYVLFLKNKDVIYNDKTYGRFLLKRMAGIYPAYMVICMGYLLLDQSLPLLDRLTAFPMDVMLLQSTVTGSFSSLHHGGSWFISCLLFCYLLFPPFLGLIRNMPVKARMCLILFLYFVSAYMPVAVHVLGYSTTYPNIFMRCIQFMTGMMIARFACGQKKVYHQGLLLTLTVAFYAVLITGITLFYKIGGNYQDYDFVVIPVFSGLIYLAPCIQLTGRRLKRIFGSNIFQYINEICYEFFLGQFWCFKITQLTAVRLGFTDNLNLMLLLAFVICLLSAVLIHELITKPARRLLRRI